MDDEDAIAPLFAPEWFDRTVGDQPFAINMPRMSGKTAAAANDASLEELLTEIKAFKYQNVPNPAGQQPSFSQRQGYRSFGYTPFPTIGNNLDLDRIQQFCLDNGIDIESDSASRDYRFTRPACGCELRITEEYMLRMTSKTFIDLFGDEMDRASHEHPTDDQQEEKENSMLEKLIKLYTSYMTFDVRSPTPHLAGPPGTNKSGVAQQLADLLGVKLHIINVARINVLEIEGVQMPVDNNTKLELLLSTMWSNLKEGDIVFFDEFMRGYPEVYNGILDIMTSREVAGHKLPKVFMMGASNSVAAYDKALEDRLLHIFVPDIRKSKANRTAVLNIFIQELGLIPDIIKFDEITDMLQQEVIPMYEVLDQFKNNKPGMGTVATNGRSIRNLIGQVKLREVTSKVTREVIDINNTVAMQQGKPQYVVLLDGRRPPAQYKEKAEKLVGNPKLTTIQALNLDLNLQLIEMEAATNEVPTTEVEDEDDTDL